MYLSTSSSVGPVLTNEPKNEPNDPDNPMNVEDAVEVKFSDCA